MLNQIGKKCLWGLITIAIISTFTSCANYKQTEPINKNKEVGSVKADTLNNTLESNNQNKQVNKNIEVDSVKVDIINDTPKNNNQLLDSWVGDYIFTEYINSKDYSKFYDVFISKENSNYSAKIKTSDTGAGVYSYLHAKINGDTNHIDFIFSDYLPDETNTNKPYNAGDILLSFTKTGTGISTHWGKIVPTSDINKADGTYFKARENSEGYMGHWYTSLPHTGGNSTTIEIKEMSNTSVSFQLYFARTYKFEGTNIKLENNVAKFVDNGDYKTSGTIEFINKSIVVTIEKTDLPILKTGKTGFNYKVSEFNPVNTTPYNGATEVDLGKGIEIDFGRRISPTVNPSTLIRKANATIGPNDGHVSMDVEIKGNKIIVLPNYDMMKSLKQVIESEQKYKLTIGDGQYRDDVGNINNELVLEFTTKK